MTIPMTAFGWPPRRSRGGSRLPGNICTLTTPIFCKGGSRQEESCRRSDSTSDNRIPKCLIARDPKLKSNRLQDYNLGRDVLPTTCFPRHCVSFLRAGFDPYCPMTLLFQLLRSKRKAFLISQRKDPHFS